MTCTSAPSRTPIDYDWIADYCDRLLKVAEGLPEGPLRDAMLLRVQHVMDLVMAWNGREGEGIGSPTRSADAVTASVRYGIPVNVSVKAPAIAGA